MKLVVVESPAKCSKIQGFLGEGYKVHATFGHIRALQESLDSVGIDRGWEPTYAELKTKKDAIQKLRVAAKGCEVILATDDDREGEGIAWHVCFILKLNPLTNPRIVFHEITKPAIQTAVANPRRLDMNKVNAQQARAMLDLLVGFTISRVLWNRVAPKLSAGRCQTPALRLVVERDQEVEHHSASAFWRMRAEFKYLSTLILKADANIEYDSGIKARDYFKTIVANTSATVQSVKETVSISNPPKPLITSTLQQEASSLHGINPKATMAAAQKLYEAGHITYMRTDNPVISEEAIQTIRTYVAGRFGEAYLGKGHEKETNEIKKKVGIVAQAAHEAIRPTHPDIPDVHVDDSTQNTIYTLIWRRATQSQMAPAQTDVRKITIEIDANREIVWNVEQTKLRFAGWRILENKVHDDTAWNDSVHIKVGTKLHWFNVCADEMFTKPKGRFTEASLINELEKRGIGRPSTFASLISTIEERNYVEKTNVEGHVQDSQHIQLLPNVWPPTERKESHKVGAEKNKMRATPLGKSVCVFLTREYADLFDYTFTAGMEQHLDEVAKGEKPWKDVLQTTWDTYKDRYAEHSVKNATTNSKERILGNGIKVILSKKGPLFVKEGSNKAKAKAIFAQLPPSATFETATVEDAEQAFIQRDIVNTGELVGMLNTDEIRKKKGPYGMYAECKGVKVTLKGEETLEQIQEKLSAKMVASESVFSRVLGDYTIKRGPYGLYFYKHTLKKAKFIKFPTALDPDKVNLVDIQALYSDGLKKK